METEFLSQPDTRVGDMIDGVIAKRGTPLEFVVVSAFASLPTVLRLKPKIAEIKAAKCDARLVLGVDLGGTSKEVLQEVASWGVPVIVVKNRMFGVTFHPKIYLLRWKDHAEIIVGSNNLTDGGLYRNYEASSRTAYSLPTDQAAFDKAQKELKRFLKPAGPVATALTPAYLEVLLALPEIPSEATARRKRAEGIPKRPPSNAFANRDPDETLANWLESIERDLLRQAFAREGTLREEEKNVATLMKLTEEGSELENATLATFSGKAGSPNHLNLITLHSAKGLEYEVVFLFGMDEGRLPSWADNTDEKRAEARRHFYVGLTRAKREVHLTYSGFNENKYGTRFDNGPSPFLMELEERIGFK